MARKPKTEENDMAKDETDLNTADLNPEAAQADEPIVPGVVTVENAVSEDQMREKVRRMARGRKNYELCGTLKASPSTISNFIKGSGGATSKMLAGLGVREQVVYVIDDVEAFNNLSAE